MKPRRIRLCAHYHVFGARTVSTAAARIKASLLSRPFPVEYDRLDRVPPNLLYTSLSGFLPPPPSYYKEAQALQPGAHLVYFPPAVPERDLLPDGTDTLHAPDRSYKFRLWAGGDVTYPYSNPIKLRFSREIVLQERIVDVKVKGDGEGEDAKSGVWVKIQREIGRFTLDKAFSNPDHPVPSSFGTPLIVENRWLVFFKRRPEIALDKITAPPTRPYYDVKLRTTPALLFRFSALTFNAHAIHLDPEYTKQEYGLPERLVHGPLTFVLMMEVLARGLDRCASNSKERLRGFMVRKVEYRNVMPVFVGEEIVVCCKRAETARESGDSEQDAEDERVHEQWEIWIQKNVDGKPSLCVRGTAKVYFEREVSIRKHLSAKGREQSLGFRHISVNAH